MFMSNPVPELVQKTIEQIRSTVDVNTVIGDPIETGGVTILPISKVAFGFATGGSEAASKHRSSGPNNLMGGGGAGVTVTPLGFLIIKDGNVRYLGIPEPAHGSIDRIIEKAPDLMDQISGLLDKAREKKQAAEPAE